MMLVADMQILLLLLLLLLLLPPPQDPGVLLLPPGGAAAEQAGGSAGGAPLPLRHLRQGPWQVPRPGGQVSSQSSSNRGVFLKKKTLFPFPNRGMGGNFVNVFF